jgi:putative membrane protein
MTTAALIATALIAVLHVYILVLEMFLWDTPRGRKVFGTTPEFATASKTLAANQGLYNGFLAAGLAWGISSASRPIELFFLGCVVVAGIYGGATANKRIIFVQAVPGAIAFALVMLA